MEVGWTELMVIAIVALVVIGPKDLPEMFRTLGRFTAKLKSMSRDFSRAMEDAAKDAGVNDIANDLRKVANPKSMGLDAVKSAADKFEKWDPLKGTRITPGTASSGGASLTTPAAAVGLGSAAAATDATATSTEALGVNTAALAEKQAERKAIAAEAAAKLRAHAADRSQSEQRARDIAASLAPDAFVKKPVVAPVNGETAVSSPASAPQKAAAAKAPRKVAASAAAADGIATPKPSRAKVAKPAAEAAAIDAADAPKVIRKRKTAAAAKDEA